MADPSHHLIDTATGEIAEATDSVLLERISHLEHDLSSAERDLRAKRRRIAALEAEKQKERESYEERETIIRLFEFWRVKTKHPRSKLTNDRFDCLRWALDSGYSAREIALAIAGAAFDCFEVRQKNGRIRRFNDLTLICRDGTHLESFALRAPQQKRPADPSST